MCRFAHSSKASLSRKPSTNCRVVKSRYMEAANNSSNSSFHAPGDSVCKLKRADSLKMKRCESGTKIKRTGSINDKGFCYIKKLLYFVLLKCFYYKKKLYQLIHSEKKLSYIRFVPYVRNIYIFSQ